MSLIHEWSEVRLWYSGNVSQDKLFEFKKHRMLRILDEFGIHHFLTLDEPKFTLIRVETSPEIAAKISASVQTTSGDLFSRVTIEVWNPAKDARDRIISSRERAGLPKATLGWKVKGIQQVEGQAGKWIISDEDLERQEEAFATFMSRVLGQFTRSYLKEMPYRVDDRWLMSLFIHLMLDSISTWQGEESEARSFPYI